MRIMDPDPGLDFPRNDAQDDPVATFFFRILSRIRCVSFAPLVN